MDDNALDNNEQLPVTDRTRLRRHPERAVTDRATLDAILDAGWLVHVAFAGPGDEQGGQPFVIPTTYVRLDRSLYIHGAVASRMLRAGAAGIDLCATVTLLDGLVLARSAFSHSMNYRSAVILGHARVIEDPDEKARVLTALVDRLIPGRSRVARPPTAAELKQTMVLALPLDEVSVKVRSGPPRDAEGDLGWPVWAGTIPLTVASGAPIAADGSVGIAPERTMAGPIATAAPTPSPSPAPAPAAAPVEQRHGEWTISDDRARIDFACVADWLAGSYWCPGIPRAAVEQAARHSSLVVGAFTAGGEQVGYLRVVSDRTRFANIMDVFVAPARRGQGLGRALVRFALNHPDHRGISRWLLGTKDAHGVYAHEGFRPLDEPDRLMQRVGPTNWLVPAAGSPSAPGDRQG